MVKCALIKSLPIPLLILISTLLPASLYAACNDLRLQHAISKKNEMLIWSLLNSSTDIKQPDCLNASLLTAVKLFGGDSYKKVIDELLNQGADINALDKNGMTPLLHAIKNKNLVLAKYLLTVGAKPEVPIKTGMSSIAMTLRWNQGEEAQQFLELLLQHGAIINVSDEKHTMPVIWAWALGGHGIPLLIDLVQKGASLEAVDKYGDTVLIHSVSRSHPLLMETLIKLGANVNYVSPKKQRTALSAVFDSPSNRRERSKFIEILLQNGANPDLGRTLGKYKEPVLIAAVRYKNLKWLRDFIEAGANVNIMTKFNSPLIESVRLDLPDITALLIKHGADINARTEGGNRAINLLVVNNMPERLDALIRLGADVNLPDYDGYAPLLYATSHEFNKVVRVLLDNGANVNVRNIHGRTPLMLAIMDENLTLVKWILEAGADINQQDKYNDTELYLAASSRNRQIFEYLFKHGARPDFKKNDWQGFVFKDGSKPKQVLRELTSTPLINTVKENDQKRMQKLLKQKVDVNTTDMEGRGALHMAASLGRIEDVEQLLAHGANINQRDVYGGNVLIPAIDGQHKELTLMLIRKGIDINFVTSRGKSPLMSSLAMGNTEVAKVLLDNGATIDGVLPTGYTVLYFAAKLGDHNLLDRILKSITSFHKKDIGALEIAASQGDLTTLRKLIRAGILGTDPQSAAGAFLKAADSQNFRIMEELLKYGVNINASERLSESALIQAAERRKVKLMLWLLEHGADVNHRNTVDNDALAMAVKRSHMDGVSILLAHGANLEGHGHEGMTPLMQAARHGRADMVNYLLWHGADPHGRDKSGRTALMFAAERNKPEIVQILLANGADPRAVNDGGRSALDLAAIKRQDAVIKILMQQQLPE